MSANWKRPFPDDTPVYTTVQSVSLAKTRGVEASGDTVRKLLQRRDSEDIALVPTAETGRKTLVARDRVLARLTVPRDDGMLGMQPGPDWRDEAREAFELAGYVRRDLGLGLDAKYSALTERLDLYERAPHAGGGIAGVTDEPPRPDELQGELPLDVAAGHVYFSLLQVSPVEEPADEESNAGDEGQPGGDLVAAAGGGGTDVVVKAPGGPTKVQLTLAEPLELPKKPAGTRVAVIDTGIAPTGKTHPMLNVIDRAQDRSNIDELDRLPPGQPGFLDFGAGHGTFAAGVIRQVDPDAQITMYRALNTDGLGDDIGVARALIDAFEDRAMVINLSLGTHTVDGEPPAAIQAAIDAIKESTDDETRPVFVAAAGNAGTEERVYPAACDDVIGVAALSLDGPADWSSRGPWVQFSTIGEGVLSTFVEGTEDPGLDGQPGTTFGATDWGMWTGTSFAAPQIAGAISRICREDNVSPTEAVRRLPNRGELQGETLPDYGVPMRILPAG